MRGFSTAFLSLLCLLSAVVSRAAGANDRCGPHPPPPELGNPSISVWEGSALPPYTHPWSCQLCIDILDRAANSSRYQRWDPTDREKMNDDFIAWCGPWLKLVCEKGEPAEKVRFDPYCSPASRIGTIFCQALFDYGLVEINGLCRIYHPQSKENPCHQYALKRCPGAADRFEPVV